MGIKRSANIVANTLDCRSWLRNEGGNEDYDDDGEKGIRNGRRSRGGGGGVLTNQFRHLQWSDDESSDSDSSSSASSSSSSCSSDSDQDEEQDCHRDLLVVD